MSLWFKHKKVIAFLFGLLFVVGVAAIGSGVLAQTAPTPNAFGLEQATNTGLGTGDIRLTVARIIRVVLSFLGIIALVIMLYGGYIYMTAGGNEEKVAQARKIITNGTIGLAIILSSFAITQFIITRLGQATGSLPSQTPQSCADPSYATANPVLCSTGTNTFNPCVGNTNQQFVVRTITPSTPGSDTLDVANVSIRVIFSQPLAAGTAVTSTFSIRQDGTDVSNQFTYQYIDTNRTIVEAVPNNGTATAGQFDVDVRGDLQSASGGGLQTQTQCGTFSRSAQFRLSPAGGAGNLAIDTVDPTIVNNAVTFNGTTYGGAIALPRGQVYTIGAALSDDNGIGYVNLQIIPPAGGTPITVYDGPPITSGSATPAGQPYQFAYQLVLANNTATNQPYNGTLTVFDVDGNSTSQPFQFIVVGQSCTFGTGAGSDPNCRGNGGCTNNAQCVSGQCNTTTGQCVVTPIITDVSPWDGAGGNWITVLGQFFGEAEGTVEFGIDTDTDGTIDQWVPAGLAQCGGEDVWRDGWIIVEVPRNDAAFPNNTDAPIRVTRFGSGNLNDVSNDNRGPVPGPRQGLFRKDNSLVRPGLCSVTVVPGQTNATAGATASIPDVQVQARGQSFGSSANAGQISFGGVQAQVSNWTETTIDTTVPRNLQPGRVGVLVTAANGQVSNGVPFTILSAADNQLPVITSITPGSATRGSYVTIAGQRFGNTTGIVYLADQRATACPGNGCLQMPLPQACGSGVWSDTQIIAEIPTNLTRDTRYNIIVQNSETSQQSQVNEGTALDVVAGGPLPSICSLTPSSGPAPQFPVNGTNPLTITGANFSTTPTVYFWGQGSTIASPLTNAELATWLSSSLTSATNPITYAVNGQTEQITTAIPVQNGFSMQTGPIVVQSAGGQVSNPVQYTVTDCRNLSPGEIPTGQRCCTEGPSAGVLRPSNFICPGETRDGGYVWRFTTGAIARVPHVVEQCNQENWDSAGTAVAFPSPTPWADPSRPQGRNVCLNRDIAVRFNMDMDQTSFANNVRLFRCASDGQGEIDCAGNNRVDIGTEMALNYNARVLTVRSAPLDGSNNLQPDTWYRVELLTGIQSQEQIAELGVTTTKRQALQATRPCGTGTAYCFDFRTGAVNTVCTLTAAGIQPPAHTVSRLGLVLTPGTSVAQNLPYYYVVWGRGNQACSALTVDGLGWNWQIAQGQSTALQQSATVAVSPSSDYSDSRAEVTAAAHTAPQSVQIEASLPAGSLAGVATTTAGGTTNTIPPATSNLTVNLGEPSVTEFWPHCSEACINATVGARFSREMNVADYQNGFNVYPCTNQTNCTPSSTLGAAVAMTVDATLSTRRELHAVPANNALFQPDTWYLAEVTRAVRSVGAVNASGTIQAFGPPLPQNKWWIFKTTAQGTVCVADNVRVQPDPFTALLIGQKTRYRAFPHTDPDACNARGQDLNPWGFGWRWQSSDPLVASTTIFASAGVAKSHCTNGCTPAGSDVASTNPVPLCGNGTVDSGEDCDIAATISPASTIAEVPGVSCTLNCLRPGNTNAGTDPNQPLCGNGIVDSIAGEECDPADPNAQHCSATCTNEGTPSFADFAGVQGSYCGNANTNEPLPGPGEDCEISGPNAQTSQYCSAACTNLGTPTAQLWCDNPINAALTVSTTPAGQTPQCRNAVSVCGNSQIESGEECEVRGGVVFVYNVNDPNNPIATDAPLTSCSNRCLLQNICNTNVPNSGPNRLRCNEQTDRDCRRDCTLAGSSVSRYGTPSICGDAVVGPGEVSWCEYTIAEARRQGVPGQNPVQAVTAVGQGSINSSGSQQTNIQATITRVRNQNTDIAPANQISGQGTYTLQCGYTEFATPKVTRSAGVTQTQYNDCPNAAHGVASNSCCYPRPTRSTSYPVDGQGLASSVTQAQAAPVCRNTLISVTFDGRLDRKTVEDNILLATGFSSVSVRDPNAPEPVAGGVATSPPSPLDTTTLAETYLAPFTSSSPIAGVQVVAGRVFNALQFDGVTGYLQSPPSVGAVQVPSQYNYASRDYTVHGWVRMSGSAAERATRQFVMAQGGASSRWAVNINPDAQRVGRAEVTVCADATVRGANLPPCAAVTSQAVVNDGQWHHIAVTFDRDANMTLYVDGIREGATDISGYIGNTINGPTDHTNYAILVGAAYSANPGAGPQIQLPFRGLIDEMQIDNRLLRASEIVNLASGRVGATSRGNCGPGQIEVTNIVSQTLNSGNPAAPGTPSAPRRTVWHRIWDGIRNFFARLWSVVFASQTTDPTVQIWCAGEVTFDARTTPVLDANGNTVSTTVSLYLKELLAENTTYAVLMRGGKNGILDTRGVGIGASSVNTGSLDDSIIFRTGAEICKLKAVNVSPKSHLYTIPNTSTLFTAFTESTNGQQIVPIAGQYNWQWDWAPQNDPIFAIPAPATPPASVNTPTLRIGSKDLEGTRTANARAAVTEDADTQNNHVGRVFSGSTELTSIFCENPWPGRSYYPYEEGVPFGSTTRINNDGTDTQGAFDGSPVPPVNLAAQVVPGNTPVVAPPGLLGPGSGSGAPGIQPPTGPAPGATSVCRRLTNATSWWPLDSSSGAQTTDIVGGSNGSVTGAVFTPAQVGNGLRFDGVDDFVQIPFTTRLNPSASNFTVHAWINTSQQTGSDYDAIISKIERGGLQSGYIMAIGSGQGTLGQGQLCLWTGAPDNWLCGGPQITDGQWHHVAALRRGTTAEIYVDGVQVGSGTRRGNMLNNQPARIGNSIYGNNAFDGILDEVAYHSRALTQADITAIITAARAQVCRVSAPQGGNTVVPGGPTAPTYFNYRFSYCADAGVANDKTDDLPFLKPFHFGTLLRPGQCSQGGQACFADSDCAAGSCTGAQTYTNDNTQLGTLKRTLFFNDTNDDVVGVQVFANPQRLSARKWFENHPTIGPDSSRFRSITIAGYDAITDGSNYYINALNQGASGSIFNNVYQVSINADAKEATRTVFTKLINSLEFNINISDVGYCLSDAVAPPPNGALPSGQTAARDLTNISSIACTSNFDCLDSTGLAKQGTNGICSNAKTKFLRDWERLQSVQDAQRKIESKRGSFPTLKSGSFIPSYTVSRWPSWGQLSSEVGGIKRDPLDTWTSCGVCAQPRTTSCTTNADCPGASNTCNSGTCSVTQTVGCTADTDCPGAGNSCTQIEGQTCWDAASSNFICPRVHSVFGYTATTSNYYQIHAPLEYFNPQSNVVSEFVNTNNFTTAPICTAALQAQSPFSSTCGDGVLNPATEQCDPPGRTVLTATGLRTTTVQGRCGYDIRRQSCTSVADCPVSLLNTSATLGGGVGSGLILTRPTSNTQVRVEYGPTQPVCVLNSKEIIYLSPTNDAVIPPTVNPVTCQTDRDCKVTLLNKIGRSPLWSLAEGGVKKLTNATTADQLSCRPLQSSPSFSEGNAVRCVGGGTTNATQGQCPVVNGIQQLAPALCNSQCQLQYGTCQVQGQQCGNGVVEGTESCDDGSLNGTYGSCNTRCNGPHNQFCGNGRLDVDAGGNPVELCEVQNLQTLGFCQKRSCQDGRVLRNVSSNVTNGYPAGVDPRSSFMRVHTVDARTSWATVGFIRRAVGISENVMKTTDGGQTWTERTFQRKGYNNIFFLDANTGWGVGPRGLVDKFTDSPTGLTVTDQSVRATANLSDIAFVDQNNGWAVGARFSQGVVPPRRYGTIFRSTSGGTRWSTQHEIQFVGSALGIPYTFTKIEMIDAQNGWVLVNDGRVLRTTNGGQRWAESRVVNARTFYAAFPDAQTAYVIDANNDLHKTTDGAQTWQKTFTFSQAMTGIEFLNTQTGFAIGLGGKILQTRDGGATWFDFRSGTTQNLQRISMDAAGNGFIIGAGNTMLRVQNEPAYCAGTTNCSANTDCQFSDQCLANNTAAYHIDRVSSCAFGCQSPGGYCGDGVVQTPYEECDDANSVNTDSCSNFCLSRVDTTSQQQTITVGCGNGRVDSGEACDLGQQNGIPCSPQNGQSCSYCSRDCREVLTVDSTAFCGNGRLDAGEVCDIETGSGLVLSAASGGTLQCSGAQNFGLYRGAHECQNSCSSIRNGCVLCGLKQVVNGGVTPRVALLNPMLKDVADLRWYADTHIALYGTSGTSGNPDTNPYFPHRSLSSVGAYRSLSPLVTVAGVETNALCSADYKLRFDQVSDPNPSYYIAYGPNGGTANPAYSASAPDNRIPGDYFDYPVTNQGGNVDNEYIVSPAVPQGSLRVVVRWTDAEDRQGNPKFLGGVYAAPNVPYTYTRALTSPVRPRVHQGQATPNPGGPVRVAGRVGLAWQFDGGSSRIVVPHHDEFNMPNTNAVTVEAWIRPDLNELGTVSDSTILAKVAQGRSPVYALEIENNKLVFRADVQGENQPVAVSRIDMSTFANEWVHVAGTYDRRNLRVYINGQDNGNQVAPATGLGALTSSNGDVVIGARASGSQVFDGLIDEISLYNRALSQVQLNAIWSAATAGKFKLIAPRAGALQPFNSERTWRTSGMRGWWDADQARVGGQPATFARDIHSIESNGICTTVYHKEQPPSLTPATLIYQGQRLGRIGYTPGLIGNAFTFSGATTEIVNGQSRRATARLRVADTAALDLTNAITAMAWVNTGSIATDDTSEHMIIGKNTYRGAQADFHGPYSLFVQRPRVNGNITIRWRVQNLNGTFEVTTSLPSGPGWRHYTGTYDGTTARLYIDGNEVASRALPNTPSDLRQTDGDVIIGDYRTYRDAANDAPFIGQIDEVQLYNTVLPPNIIRSIGINRSGVCKTGVGGGCVSQPSGLIGWWTGDNNPGFVTPGRCSSQYGMYMHDLAETASKKIFTHAMTIDTADRAALNLRQQPHAFFVEAIARPGVDGQIRPIAQFKTGEVQVEVYEPRSGQHPQSVYKPTHIFRLKNAANTSNNPFARYWHVFNLIRDPQGRLQIQSVRDGARGNPTGEIRNDGSIETGWQDVLNNYNPNQDASPHPPESGIGAVNTAAAPPPPPPPCTAAAWNCTNFTPQQCPQTGQRTRTCVLVDTVCTNPGAVQPTASQTCTRSCLASDWNCTAWSQCSPQGSQTRTCTGPQTGICVNAGAVRPPEQQSCAIPCSPQRRDRCVTQNECTTTGQGSWNNNQCVPRNSVGNGGVCTNNANACLIGSSCVNGTCQPNCRAGNLSGCPTATECTNAGGVFNAGRCVARNSIADGQVCTDHLACGTNSRCLNSVCTNNCRNNNFGGCTDQNACTNVGGVWNSGGCVAAGSVGDGAACTNSAACWANSSCVSGRCTTNCSSTNLAACTNPAACRAAGGYMNATTCIAPNSVTAGNYCFDAGACVQGALCQNNVCTIPTGPMMWLRMEEQRGNLFDSATTYGANHATVIDPPVFYNQDGRIGRAFGTSGLTRLGPLGSTGDPGYAEVPAQNADNVNLVGPMTIEMWVNHPGQESNGGFLLTKGGRDAGGATRYIYRLNISTWRTNFPTQNRFSFINSSGANFTSTQEVTPDRWHHIAVVLDNCQGAGRSRTCELRFYVDGNEERAPNRVPADETQVFRSPLTIGALAGQPFVSPYRGLIDELKIHATALTASQIQNIVASAPPLCTPTNRSACTASNCGTTGQGVWNSNSCVAAGSVANGQACTDPTACASGSCQNGRCAALPDLVVQSIVRQANGVIRAVVCNIGQGNAPAPIRTWLRSPVPGNSGTVDLAGSLAPGACGSFTRTGYPFCGFRATVDSNLGGGTTLINESDETNNTRTYTAAQDIAGPGSCIDRGTF